jgi:hypothetical protein
MAHHEDYQTTIRVLGQGRQNYACKNSVWLRDRAELDAAKGSANDVYTAWKKQQSERGGVDHQGGWVLVQGVEGGAGGAGGSAADGPGGVGAVCIPPREITEIILSASARAARGRSTTILLEGLITNFFVVCCEVRGDDNGNNGGCGSGSSGKNGNSGSGSKFVVQTAGRGVLPGQMRELVLAAVKALGQHSGQGDAQDGGGEWAGRVRVSLEAPALHHNGRWEAAFLTSKSKKSAVH